MGSWPAWLRHAFAVESSQDPVTPDQERVVDTVAREVVRRQLTTPAVAFLEMSRPLNFITAQALHFLAPAISVLTTTADHEVLASFLERRDSLDRLMFRIDYWEQQSQPIPDDQSAVEQPARPDVAD